MFYRTLYPAISVSIIVSISILSINIYHHKFIIICCHFMVVCMCVSLSYSATSAPPTASSSTVSSCDSPSSPVAAVALVSEAVIAFVVVVFIREEGLSSVAVVLPVGNGIPLSHLHNVTSLSPFVLMLSIPAATTPFNGASIPVELVWKTTVTIPLPPP